MKNNSVFILFIIAFCIGIAGMVTSALRTIPKPNIEAIRQLEERSSASASAFTEDELKMLLLKYTGLEGDSFGKYNMLASTLSVFLIFCGLMYEAICRRDDQVSLRMSINAQDQQILEMRKQLKTQALSAQLEGYTTLYKHYEKLVESVGINHGNIGVNAKKRHEDNKMSKEKYWDMLKQTLEKIEALDK